MHDYPDPDDPAMTPLSLRQGIVMVVAIFLSRLVHFRRRRVKSHAR